LGLPDSGFAQVLRPTPEREFKSRRLHYTKREASMIGHRSWLACVLALVLAVAPASPVSANQQLNDLTNRYRVNHGLKRLWTSDHLQHLAGLRAREIYYGAFEHSWWWINRVPNSCGWGENILYRIPAVDDNRGAYAFRRFRDSPVHRKNLLGRWNKMASAIFIAPNGGMYVAQLFVKNC
jgi:uncharacterized protein YkwD